jgi:hypothetical protein
MTRIRQMQRTPRKSGLLTADIYKNAGVHQLNPAEDLLVSTDASGARFYALNIPRAKQHGGRTRDSSKTRYCNKQVGRLLELLIESNRALKNDPMGNGRCSFAGAGVTSQTCLITCLPNDSAFN